MGTGWEQRLAQIDAELAELGEPREGTETLRARIAALSRGDPAELDQELEHMERLTRAASRRSFAERASEGAVSAGVSGMEMEGATTEASPVAQGDAGKGGASGAAPSWAQTLFDEAESAEDEEEEVDLGLASETVRDARGSVASSGGSVASSERDASADDSEGLAALLEGDEETGPDDSSGDAPRSGEAVGVAASEADATKEPVLSSADAGAVRADAESEEDEDYAEIDTGEVEVLVDEDDVVVEEDESGLNQGSEL